MRCNTLLVLVLIISSLVFIPFLGSAQSDEADYDFILSIQESGLKDITAVFVSPDGTKAGLIEDSTTVYVYDLSLRRMSLQREFNEIRSE